MKKALESRGIEYVWHFTRLSNLKSILYEGLIPRAELEVRANHPAFNDVDRFDRQRNASCCSIGHPNYKMFYALRKAYPNEDWAVLAIKSDVLWEKDCAFCVENAASSNVTYIPIEARKGIDAFNKLFDEINGKPSRKELGISDASPTNPQAEILIFGHVEPKYIVAVICPSKAIENKLKSTFNEVEFFYNKGFYSARKDYKHW